MSFEPIAFTPEVSTWAWWTSPLTFCLFALGLSVTLTVNTKFSARLKHILLLLVFVWTLIYVARMNNQSHVIQASLFFFFFFSGGVMLGSDCFLTELSDVILLSLSLSLCRHRARLCGTVAFGLAPCWNTSTVDFYRNSHDKWTRFIFVVSPWTVITRFLLHFLKTKCLNDVEGLKMKTCLGREFWTLIRCRKLRVEWDGKAYAIVLSVLVHMKSQHLFSFSRLFPCIRIRDVFRFEWEQTLIHIPAPVLAIVFFYFFLCCHKICLKMFWALESLVCFAFFFSFEFCSADYVWKCSNSIIN